MITVSSNRKKKLFIFRKVNDFFLIDEKKWCDTYIESSKSKTKKEKHELNEKTSFGYAD